MKKAIKTLILTTLMVMAGSLSAQSLINGGFDFMQLRVGDNKPANYPGFHVGAATNVALSRHIGVTPGIFFSRHTGDNQTAVAGITHHSKYTESTVNIPVLPNVRLYISEISYFYIFAGPEFNIGISAKSDNWVEGLDSHLEKNYYDDKTVSASEEIRRYNISVMSPSVPQATSSTSTTKTTSTRRPTALSSAQALCSNPGRCTIKAQSPRYRLPKAISS